MIIILKDSNIDILEEVIKFSNTLNKNATNKILKMKHKLLQY